MGHFDDADVNIDGAGQCFPIWGPVAAGLAPIGLFDVSRSRTILKTGEVVGIEQLLPAPILALQRHILSGEIHTPIFRHVHVDEQVSDHYAHIQDSHIDTYVNGQPILTHSLQRDVHEEHFYRPIIRHSHTFPMGVIRQPFTQVRTQPMIENGIARHVHHESVYSIIENSSKSLLGGVLGFVAIGPIAAGLGVLANFRWDVHSHRTVLGRQSAYAALELDPPKYAAEIFNWKDKFTDISWLQQRGVKVVGGLYSGVGAGFADDIMGVWRHRVVKVMQASHAHGRYDEIITITLSLQSRHRLEGVAGLFPFVGAKKTLTDASRAQEIQFSFKNIRNHPVLITLLDELIQGYDKTAIIRAKQMADSFHDVAAPPLVFARDRVTNDSRNRKFFRLRIPAIMKSQKITLSRLRKIEETVRVGHEDRKRTIDIAEVIYKEEKHYPIESCFRQQEHRIYPERVGMNAAKHLEFPLDYRNNNYAEHTQIRVAAQGSEGAPLQNVSVKYQWKLDDNYVTRQGVVNKLKRIGSQTGLMPLIPNIADIPMFQGPANRSNDNHESIAINLEIFLSARDKSIIKTNIIRPSFESNVILLLSEYNKHPNYNYLQLDKSKLDEVILRDRCRKIISKAREILEITQTNKKPWFFGLFKRTANNDDIRVMEAELFHMIKVSPFIFLQALYQTNPKALVRMAGTSIEDKLRDIDIALARDIMCNQAMAPQFQPRSQLDVSPAVVFHHAPIKTIRPGMLADEYSDEDELLEISAPIAQPSEAILDTARCSSLAHVQQVVSHTPRRVGFSDFVAEQRAQQYADHETHNSHSSLIYR